jgi:hypothetical protein
MNIGIDESGSFVYSSASDTWNCVAAYAFPEVEKRPLSKVLSRFKRCHGVSSKEELKVAQADEDKYLTFLGELARRSGTLHVVATDASTNTPEAIAKHQKGQAEKIVEHVDIMHYESMKTELRELARRVEALPVQLYIQMQCQLQLVLAVVNTAVLYYVQRYPQTLRRFRWRIDQKNSSKTEYEDAYLKVLPAFLQSASINEPLIMLREGIYSWFDRFHYPRGEEPTYLQDVYGIKLEDADDRKLDIGKVVQEDMELVDSKQELAVQVADLLASGFRRCLRNGFRKNLEVAERIGSLMVQAYYNRPPVRLVAFGDMEGYVNNKAGAAINRMREHARPMVR